MCYIPDELINSEENVTPLLPLKLTITLPLVLIAIGVIWVYLKITELIWG